MKRLVGGLLIAIGILIAGASGLCSLFVLAGSLADISMLGAVLLFGGPPIAVGAGLIWGGRSLIRSGRIDDEREGNSE
ncbi:MAG TPA: hypothetical protein VM145_03890 [Sphingomicrobium sp.]|nr:hypothetical protein [Sphingomicrobium sp.]